jgi:hypothetical protein
MSWFLSRQMSQRVPDTQCGFRLYRCDAVPDVSPESGRFDYDSEILLRMDRAGVRMAEAPVKVIYSDEKSKVSPIRDTIRFVSMLKRWKREKETPVD